MTLSRRSFLAFSAMLPWALRAGASASLPVGLELYSVRNTLEQDPDGTLRAVAKMGYQGVEFYAPYFEWTEAETKQTRKLLDDLGIRCFSTHNSYDYFKKENLARARDMNLTLGSGYMVMASSPQQTSLDGWKSVADVLNSAAEQLEPAGLKAGYHNHQVEFTPQARTAKISGSAAQFAGLPIEVLAKSTKPSIMLQLDVGTCLEAGSDPVAWIRANPGRIRSMHCKDWSPDPAKGYTVLFGEGAADWKKILAAVEDGGGLEYYLIEQEGSRYSELETAEKCLQEFRTMHPA